MEPSLDAVEIPNRSVFRAAEVCELAAVPPYVLRGWEAEFPDLGVSKSGGQRVYRRADVEKVLRLKHLILNDGLTLAGARKVMAEEGSTAPIPEAVEDSEVAAMMDEAVLSELREVKDGLEWILSVLGGHTANGDFKLQAPRVLAAPKKAKKVVKKPAPAKKSKPAKKAGKKK